MTSIISTIVSGALTLANEYIADPAQREQFALEMATLQSQSQQAETQADAQVAISQAEVNKIEAASEDAYTSRARPTIMYICGIGFGYQYILQPFIILFASFLDKNIAVPNLDMTAIGTVLLGLAGLRSFDKYKK